MIAEPYSTDQVASMLRCAVTTVEDLARKGELPGLLFGDGGYIFPAGALLTRLDELAIERSIERRKPAPKSGVLKVVPHKARPKRSPPALPSLPGSGA